HVAPVVGQRTLAGGLKLAAVALAEPDGPLALLAHQLEDVVVGVAQARLGGRVVGRRVGRVVVSHAAPSRRSRNSVGRGPFRSSPADGPRPRSGRRRPHGSPNRAGGALARSGACRPTLCGTASAPRCRARSGPRRTSSGRASAAQ